jgi:hypothetical protein
MNFRDYQELLAFVYQNGAKDGTRVAACIQLAVERGRPPDEVLENVRRFNPELFHDS